MYLEFTLVGSALRRIRIDASHVDAIYESEWAGNTKISVGCRTYEVYSPFEEVASRIEGARSPSKPMQELPTVGSLGHPWRYGSGQAPLNPEDDLTPVKGLTPLDPTKGGGHGEGSED